MIDRQGSSNDPTIISSSLLRCATLFGFFLSRLLKMKGSVTSRLPHLLKVHCDMIRQSDWDKKLGVEYE